MCLGEKWEEKPEPTGVGYKVFMIDKNKKIRNDAVCGKKPLPRRRWLNCKDYPADKRLKFIQMYFDEKYPVGFHIFKNKPSAYIWRGRKKDAKDSVVLKVKYRKAHTQGTQVGFTQTWERRKLKVVVAEEIKIE